MRYAAIALAGLALLALGVAAHADSGRFAPRAKRQPYKGIGRRGGSGATAERQRLLDQAQKLREQSNRLAARAEALEDRGRISEASDLEERAEAIWLKARQVEEKANALRFGSAPKRRGADRFGVDE